jgi:hypothetical protein
MSRHPELYQWQADLAMRLPHLSAPMIGLLALWSIGMVLVRSCGLVVVATQVASLLGLKFDAARQRLREFYQDADAKAGAKRGIKRCDFDVTTCFVPLLKWILSYWEQPRLALALDVTNLGDRLHVLCVSVLFGGIGLPVAWKILPGNQKEPWHPHWCDLLRRLKAAVPEHWQVIVLSDRGLESARLFGVIVECGWHPLMRVKNAGQFRPEGWCHWQSMKSFVPHVGSRFQARGHAYKSAETPLACTLLALRGEGYEDPWLMLTDLPPYAADPCWYAWRAWIEQGFKVTKSSGLQWQHTRMTDPARLERMWLAIAVTTLWMVAIGAEIEQNRERETLSKLPGERRPPRLARKQRLFHEGCAALRAAIFNRDYWPRGHLTELQWFSEPALASQITVTEEHLMSG